MNEADSSPQEGERAAEVPPTAADRAGRLAFLFAAGVLLSVMVSCACNPAR